jgi:hypothetical protein
MKFFDFIEVRSMAETESLMTSVERLVHYTKNIESEAPQIIPDNRPPPQWPDRGEIIYKDVIFEFNRISL